ncbi:MAG: ferrochelatase [Chlorobiaceae bacterium]
MASRPKIAVILVAHGEAETTRFSENYQVMSLTLLHAAQIMPLPLPVQKAIAVSASIKKVLTTFSDPQRSPQNRITREQAALLQRHLDQSPAREQFDFEVHAAFLASLPYAERVIDATRHCDAQVIVSMAPVDTTLSCGRLCSGLNATLQSSELAKVRVLSQFWDDERLHALYCDHLFQSAAPLPLSAPAGRRILVLLFHGTLVADVKGNPPLFRTGREASISFARRFAKAVLSDPRNRYSAVMPAYLNHDFGGRWTTPSFEELCQSLKDEHNASVDIFGCGFFSDGNETIRRADELKQSTPVGEASIISCVNSSPLFASYLAGRVSDAARQIIALNG